MIENERGANVVEMARWDLYETARLTRAGAGGELTAWGSRGGTGRAVLILPGGGYEHVSQREGEPVARRFSAGGWTPFVLRYSVAPSRFPVALREAAMAMAHIRGLTGGPVAVVGFSAGGHLAGCLATLFDGPQVADLAPPCVLRPDVLGLCYPVAVSHGATHAGSFTSLCGEDGDLKARLSLDRLVRREMPPTCLWCTRTDASVPCRNSLLLAQALDAAGVDFSLSVHRLGPHGLALADDTAFPAEAIPPHSPAIDRWPEDMMDFFAQSLGG